MLFRNGTNIIVYGMTGSGKTEFVKTVLEKKHVTNFPERIFYLYKIRQPFMDSWNDGIRPKIKFIEGLDLDCVKDGNCILIIDDLILEKQRQTAEIFIYGSHHNNITVFFLTQNLFIRDDCFRLMSLNASYFVLSCGMRSMRAVKTLAHQIFTGRDVDRVIEAYKSSSQKPYEFIVLSFLPDLPSQLTVCSNFWSPTPSFWI